MVPEFQSEGSQDRLLDNLGSLPGDVYKNPVALAALLARIERDYPGLDLRPLRAGTDSVPYVVYKKMLFNLIDRRMAPDAVGIAGCHGVSFGDHLQMFARSVICLDARSIDFAKVQEIIEQEWDHPFRSAICHGGSTETAEGVVEKYLFGKRAFGAAGGFLQRIAEKVEDGLERLFVLELRCAGVCKEDIQKIQPCEGGGTVNFRWAPWGMDPRDLSIRYPGPVDITKPEQYRQILADTNPAFFFIKAAGGVTQRWPFLAEISRHVNMLVTNDYCEFRGSHNVIIPNDPESILEEYNLLFRVISSMQKQRCETYIMQDHSNDSILSARNHICGGDAAKRYGWQLTVRERCEAPVDRRSARAVIRGVTG